MVIVEYLYSDNISHMIDDYIDIPPFLELGHQHNIMFYGDVNVAQMFAG